jgi:hypothetical protein
MLKMTLSGHTMMREGKGEAALFVALMLVAMAIIALVLGILSGLMGSYILAIVFATIVMALILLLRQDQLAAAGILLLHLYVDWYLGLSIVAQVVTVFVLAFFFLERSSRHPWQVPRVLWLWGLLLLLAIFPAIRGATSRYDLALYYPNIILGALLMFWLGTIITTDLASVRRFFKMLAGVGTLLAIITIIQYKAGILLFGSSRFNDFLLGVSDFNLVQGSDIYRLGSYFVNPDWNGVFFASIFFIPLGLLVESDKFLAKIFYLLETLAILPALLFTYSVGSWISIAIGMLIFVLLAGRMSYRILIVLFSALATVVMTAWFPAQLSALYLHALNPSVLTLRSGGWQTAIGVIQAFPLTGVGMGLQNYMLRAEPYRVPEQYRSLAHPHNSYLELGAMAGLPVLAIFLTLLLFSLWLALRNWRPADTRQKALLSGGIVAVVVLSINSLSVNGWTLPPLAALGWLILGSVSSPILIEGKKHLGRKRHEHAETE